MLYAVITMFFTQKSINKESLVKLTTGVRDFNPPTLYFFRLVKLTIEPKMF